MLVAAVDAAIEQTLEAAPGDLRDRVWSERNVTVYRHPLSAGIPLVVAVARHATARPAWRPLHAARCTGGRTAPPSE